MDEKTKAQTLKSCTFTEKWSMSDSGPSSPDSKFPLFPLSTNDIHLNTCLEILCCSVAKLCLTLCNRMDWSTPGFLVLHYLPEFAQTQVCWVGDAIQPSHPLPPLLLLHPQSLPASGSFPVSQFFTSGGQSIGASASASVLPMNIQGWFPLGLTGLISLLCKGTLKSLLHHHSSKASILWHSSFFKVQLSHPYLTTGKTIALTRWTSVGKVMSLLLKNPRNMKLK